MPHRLHATLFVVLVFPIAATAHHSVAGFFDPSTQVEIEGVVTRVRWRNPHTVFVVDVTDEAGAVATWTIESGALGVLRSRGLDREFVKVGDNVKILGDASLRSETEMFARNMLLPNGKEIMLTVGSRPHFSSDSGAVLESMYDEDIIASAKENADGIFRVWSTNIEESPRSGSRMFTGRYPLRDEAKVVQASYNAGDEVLLGCTEWSMPRLMANPLPIDFVHDAGNIVMRFEENDSRRTIHMNEDAVPAGDTLMGFSKGHWEGTALVVETTNFTPERFDNHGTPYSADMRLFERFTPDDAGLKLYYELTVTDPNTFTEPLQMQRYWIWRPEIIVGPYECEQDQQLD